ncbi:helix-turn-helix domain-containing protein [Chitinolyticbacter meiyuanensis]|uniref:helix-turn-helix domain-containing protein n=1 Tax=Chitinolyticbacter meiyuanensis TaxID=682798 RepID=UPI0011E59659|nr:helix-turn-helix transcriptional regulator [Chitinolyticbacter meiyuanensis]
MNLTGQRIRDERLRLGLNQEAFAEACGIARRTFANYEAGEQSPNAVCLKQWAAIGVDVLYVVTGERTPVALSMDEQHLIAAYRSSPLQARSAALVALLASSSFA